MRQIDPEQRKQSLENIIKELQEVIDKKNRQMAKDLKDHQTRIDTLKGDFNLEIKKHEDRKSALIAEIANLDSKLKEGLREITEGKAALESDRSDFMREKEAFKDEKIKFEAKFSGVRSEFIAIESGKRSLAAEVEASVTIIKQAKSDRLMADSILEEVNSILEDAKKQRDEADAELSNAKAIVLNNEAERSRLKVIDDKLAKKDRDLSDQKRAIEADKKEISIKLSAAEESLNGAIILADERSRALKQADSVLRKAEEQAEEIIYRAQRDKKSIEFEISRLNDKHRDLSSKISSMTAEFARIVNESNRIESDQKTVEEGRKALLVLSDELETQRRELVIASKALQDSKDAYARRLKSLEGQTETVRLNEEKANVLLVEANRMMEEATRQTELARSANAAVIKEAEKMREDAIALSTKASLEIERAAKDLESANELRAEYEKRLSESRDWVMRNSDVSNKLSVWEAALRVEAGRLQDDKIKLTLAEREFAKKQKEIGNND